MTANYHVLNYGGGTTSWQVIPSTAGSITSTGTSAQVTWNTTGGALVFSVGNCSDTLFMQSCCDDSPPNTIQVKDLTSVSSTATSIAAILHGTLTSTGGNMLITVSNQSLFLQGEFNLEDPSIFIHFENCNIYMGAGAVMYGLYYKFTGGFVRGWCKMWQGIKPNDHGVVETNGTTLSDAEYCISIFQNEIRVNLTNTTFTRNFASIFAPPTTLNNNFQFYPNTTNSSLITNCTFDGLSSITLPTYNGQWGIPKGQKSFAGMLLFNFKKAPTTLAPVSIPFDLSPGTMNTFSNLNFGIYAQNSEIDVNNCQFINIQPVPSYTSTFLYNGTGVFSSVSIGTPIKYLNVGKQNLTTFYFQNNFMDCRRGIVTLNGVDSKILYNDFVHPLGTNSISGTGIYLKDADQRNIIIQGNTFTDNQLKLAGYPNGNYASNGVVISSLTQTRKFLNLTYNTFTNLKVSLYIQNSRGSVYQDPTFVIGNNQFTFNVTPSQLTTSNTSYFGIWLNNVSRGFVKYNNFYRPVPLSQEPANFKSLSLGMNIVNCTDVSIAANDFTQFGTSFRMVSNCPGTTLKCNDMIACVQGISLANAGMTSQGWLGQSWDNKWDGFPTPSLNTYNRADGTTTNPVDWYNQGPQNNTNVYNRFSPEPVNTFVIVPTSNQPSTGCASPSPIPGGGDPRAERITKIVDGDMEYYSFPEETRYLDQEFVYYALRDDSLLRDSLPEYEYFFDSLETSNFGRFEESENLFLNGELIDALAQLNIIVEESEIEHNKIYTRSIGINQKISGDETLSESVYDELGSIAWTNAWEGGNGVFTARHLREEQVYDEERNLKLRNPNDFQEDPTFSVYPNPASETVTFFFNKEFTEKIHVSFTDLTGRNVYFNELSGNKLDIHSFAEGIYIVKVNINNQYNSSLKLTVIK